MSVWRDDFNRVTSSPSLGGDWHDEEGNVGGATLTSQIMESDGSVARMSDHAVGGGASQFHTGRLLTSEIDPASTWSSDWTFKVSGRVRRPSGFANCSFVMLIETSNGHNYAILLNVNSASQTLQGAPLGAGMDADTWYRFIVRLDQGTDRDYVKFWKESDDEPVESVGGYGSLTDLGVDFGHIESVILYVGQALIDGGTNGIEFDWLQIESLTSLSSMSFYEAWA